MDAEARGATDTRYGTTDRVEWINREFKQPQEPVRGMNPVTKQLPAPVDLASYKATPVQTVHQADGQGYGSGGEKAGLVDVKAGDLIYDEKGKQAADYQELRDTCKVSHVSDLNVAGGQARTPPNCQRSPERASFWTGRRPQHVGGV